MPDDQHRVAVQAYYLLAASAFTVETQNQFAGVTIAPHGKFPGVLLTATTGAEMIFVYDSHGAAEGRPLSWRINHKWLEREYAKLEVSKKFVVADLWAVLTWSETSVPVCCVTLVEAIDGADALRGRGKKVKTLQRDGHDMIITGEVPDIGAAIIGATVADRSLAPTNWFYPNGMQRIEQCSAALNYSHDGHTVPIAMLRTVRSNLVQIAFRDRDEAIVFLATTRDSGKMRADNPGWLDSLL